MNGKINLEAIKTIEKLHIAGEFDNNYTPNASNV